MQPGSFDPTPRGTDRPPPTAVPPAVEAVGVTKRFPGVVANDRVTFEVLPGEVHTLLGENGAGKTTLCNILTGLWKPDDGDVLMAGQPVRFRSPRDAHAAGMFMIHQHLRLVESMSVSENVVLGWSKRRGLQFSPRQVQREVAEVAEQYHMPVNPDARIWQLSLGERQRVEILKALYRGARILILDEPTTVLTPREADLLFGSMREVVTAGGSVVFISHKLPEVMAVSDRVTILRKGQAIATVGIGEARPSILAELMVGHAVAEHHRDVPDQPVGPTKASPPLLQLEGVRADGDLGLEALHDVSLEVAAGEILGIAGVAGNGQSELAEVVGGLRPYTSGAVRVAGVTLRSGDPRAAIRGGVAFVPEDRMGRGLAPGLSITDNLILKSYRDREMGMGPLLSRKKAGALARRLMTQFDVRAPGPDTRVRQLSGGNAQRVLLARELSSKPRVLVAASPTRGLDVNSTQDVWKTLLDTAASGVGVVLVSEDLDEVLSLCDRVAVFYGGRVVGVVCPREVSREKLGLMMAGAAA